MHCSYGILFSGKLPKRRGIPTYLFLVDDRVQPFEVRESVVSLQRPAAAVEGERHARREDVIVRLPFRSCFRSQERRPQSLCRKTVCSTVAPITCAKGQGARVVGNGFIRSPSWRQTYHPLFVACNVYSAVPETDARDAQPLLLYTSRS